MIEYKRLIHYIKYRLIPNNLFLKYVFNKKFGYKLSLDNPQTFNEKLQWKKLHDRNDLYGICADKYKVRFYIERKIGAKYLIPILQITDSAEKINFFNIPKPYIIKSNRSSGQNIIIENNSDIDKRRIIEECKYWLKENYYFSGKEWQYKNIKPLIIIEKLLLNKENKIPEDYKFHCFHGEVDFIQVDTDRFSNHKRTIYDKNWNELPFQYCAENNGEPVYLKDKNILKPKNLSKMIFIAEKLAKDFNYVRVDLYSINTRVFFGELTFTPGSGFEKFFPAKYDLIYGKKLKI